jgi:hypothetical protein
VVQVLVVDVEHVGDATRLDQEQRVVPPVVHLPRFAVPELGKSP